MGFNNMDIGKLISAMGTFNAGSAPNNLPAADDEIDMSGFFKSSASVDKTTSSNRFEEAQEASKIFEGLGVEYSDDGNVKTIDLDPTGTTSKTDDKIISEAEKDDENKTDSVDDAFKKIIDEAPAQYKSFFEGMVEFHKNFLEGLIKGIAEMTGGSYESIDELPDEYKSIVMSINDYMLNSLNGFSKTAKNNKTSSK